MGDVGEIIRAAGAGPFAFFALGVIVLAYLSSKWFGGDGVRVRLGIFLLLLALICVAPFLIKIVGEGGQGQANEGNTITGNESVDSKSGEGRSEAKGKEAPATNAGASSNPIPTFERSALDRCYSRGFSSGRDTIELDDVCEVVLEETANTLKPSLLACTPTLEGKEQQLKAVASLAQNIGVSTYCSSTVAARIRSGGWRDACDEFLRWNKAGGRVLAALIRRRNFERALCLDGLPEA
jgi:hypothetical protein